MTATPVLAGGRAFMLECQAMRPRATLFAVTLVTILWSTATPTGAQTLMGPLPQPMPLFPATNWWNLDITTAPVSPQSDAFIAFIGAGRTLHPDLGGDIVPGGDQHYGFSYCTVPGSQPKVAVQFLYSDESDGVDHVTDTSFPFYPIPVEAQTQPHWVECGDPATVDLRADCDRHLVMVDVDNRHLYELYNVWYDGAQWYAGSGAFFDMTRNDRRPDGWTSADAAGLAILPGLIRRDEVYGPDEIEHAFRVTVRASNSYYVYPASHRAGNNMAALPMGARLRLKPGVDLSPFPADVQKMFRAMKRYGLIVADNGSDMYITGTYDNLWDNGILNPAFRQLTASDFEVIELGWNPTVVTLPAMLRSIRVTELVPLTPTLAMVLPLVSPRDDYMPTVASGDTDRESVLGDGNPLVFYSLTTNDLLTLAKAPGQTIRFTF